MGDVAETIVGPPAPPRFGTLPPPPIVNPPAFAPIAPRMPARQPGRRWLWPLIVVGAVVALGAGGTTAWLLIGHSPSAAVTSPTTPVTTAAASAGVATPTSVATPTDASLGTGGSSVTDVEAATRQMALLQREVDAHVAFIKAVASIDSMCNVKPTDRPQNAVSYDASTMSDDIQTLRAYVATRISVTNGMHALELVGGSHARDAARSVATLWDSRNHVGGDYVNWALTGQAQASANGTCDLSHVPQTTDRSGAQSRKDRAAVWQIWSGFAASAGVPTDGLASSMVDPFNPNGVDTDLL